MNIKFVQRSEHTVSVIKTSQLKSYKKIIATGSEIKDHRNTL